MSDIDKAAPPTEHRPTDHQHSALDAWPPEREAAVGSHRLKDDRFLLGRNFVLLLILLAGVALRLYQYLTGRSLWLDESQLALNIERHGVAHLLTQKLDLNQGAPAGFLLIEKLATDAFGKSEYALRAFPLLCGLVAIVLFVVLARRTLSSPAVLIAGSFFAVSGPMIYYSSEVKQYATDTMAAIAIAIMSATLLEGSVRLRRAIVLGLLGAVLVEVSFAAVITAAAMGAVVLAVAAASRRRVRLVAVLPTLALWGGASVVFLLSYVTTLRGYQLAGQLEPGSGTTHLPSPVYDRLRDLAYDLKDLAFAAEVFHPSSSPWVLVTIAIALLGAIGAVSLMRREPAILALLLAPGVLAFVLGAAGKYSILPRSIVFLVPFVLLLTAEGIVAVVRRLPARLGVGIAIVVAGMLIVDFASFRPSMSHAGVAMRREEIKGELTYAARHWRPGDVLYIHHAAQYAFAYYAACGCLGLPHGVMLRELWPVRDETPTDPSLQFAPVVASPSPRVLIGTTFPRSYVPDIARITRHKRAWVLVTWTNGESGRKEIRRELFGALDRRARRLDARVLRGADLYLYSFTQ
jgi:uncharacterized membrane protein